jgi:hypothetical protein
MNPSIYSLRRALVAIALPAVAALAAVPVGCATARPMLSSPNVPASEGTIEATDGDNGNTNLAIRIEHLAPPAKVASGTTVYVVWIQPEGSAWQSVGKLLLDDDLAGSLDAVTSYRRFEGKVTPEPNGQGPLPTHDPVFTFNVQRSD